MLSGAYQMNERVPDFLKVRPLKVGAVRHVLTLKPATGFEYHYESASGSPRVLHLERGAVEAGGLQAAEVLSFRAGVSPSDAPTRGGFYTSPDSVALQAEAHIVIDGGVSGDSLICRSFGSWNGLHVRLQVFRWNPDDSLSLILQEDIQDANEHTFRIS